MWITKSLENCWTSCANVLEKYTTFPVFYPHIQDLEAVAQNFFRKKTFLKVPQNSRVKTRKRVFF